MQAIPAVLESTKMETVRDKRGEVYACFLGLVVGLQWLWSYSYSLGYDLTLWIYNSWFLKNSLLGGALPNWSFLSASGQPFFKMSGLIDGVLLAAFMGLWGTFEGVQLFMCFLYIVAAVGFYRLAYALCNERVAAIASSGAYILSWFMTFTVHFQAYISNFFVYAILPFFVLYFLQLTNSNRLPAALYAAFFLALGILANPQVAIKMVVIALVSLIPFLRRESIAQVLARALTVGVIALLLSAFDITSALRLREEVITANTRGNGYISPFSLVAIPAYAFSLVWEYISGFRWPLISLHEVLYAKYPGLIAFILALFALKTTSTKRSIVRWMWFILVLSYGIFFFVMPHVPAAPWIGISHNLLIIPTFFGSLLVGFGVVVTTKMQLFRGLGTSVALGALLGLGALELVALSLGLRNWGAINTRPDRLPQVATWTEVAEQIRTEPQASRYFSLYPNHSTNLFPVLTGLPTANVIELRQRLPEYQSYLDLIKRCSREQTCAQPISQLLAPINVGYIDVPAMFYTYRGPVLNPNKRSVYNDRLRLFDEDPNLQRVLVRTVEDDDLRPQATSTSWSPWQVKSPLEDVKKSLAQVVYKNTERIPASVTEGAIAIVGKGLQAEAIYEQIVLLPEYNPGRFTFILTESIDHLNPKVRVALLGYVGLSPLSAAIPQLQIEDVRDLYKTQGLSVFSMGGFETTGERLIIRFEKPVQAKRFVFISQQYFRDWHALDGAGNSVPLFKVGGGLTGAYIQAGTSIIDMRYHLPIIERIGRCVSILAWGSLFAALIALNPVLRRSIGKRFNFMGANI